MIEVKKMSVHEFSYYCNFSFENFLRESSKSSGQDVESLRLKMGGPPDDPSNDDLWLVVNFNNQNVGFVWVQLRPELKEAFGYDIFLNEDFRSKGIGREVMVKCGDILLQEGINKVKICVFYENTIARKLYSSLGFKEIDFNSERRQYTLELAIN
jgi:ribosomal protein S18 acetylase RimI-like enzyme